MRPAILLIGAAGQLGRELAPALAAIGDVVARDHEALDVTDAAAVAEAVRNVSPQYIVNAAAYTAVDRAESERDVAFAVNGRAPGLLAEAARRIDAILVHYSTDYVFDGERTTPYDETVTPCPRNVYGESKLEGERAIAASGATALTLRTSWVYSRHGQNFLTTMERLARERDELRVVADQTGVPNWTRALARATAAMLSHGPAFIAQRAGLYHLSAGGSTTWYGFARAIVEGSGVRVTPIRTTDYPTPATRPVYGVLDASRFATTFGVALPDWRILLHECLRAQQAPPRASPVH